MTTPTRAFLSIAAAAALALPLVGMANGQGAPNQVGPAKAALTCPALYDLVSGVCVSSSGDVVLAAAPAEAPLRATTQCKVGYEIITNALCIHGKSGDVVYADVLTRSAQK
jgi:hypothetical protein